MRGLGAVETASSKRCSTASTASILGRLAEEGFAELPALFAEAFPQVARTVLQLDARELRSLDGEDLGGVFARTAKGGRRQVNGSPEHETRALVPGPQLLMAPRFKVQQVQEVQDVPKNDFKRSALRNQKARSALNRSPTLQRA